MAATDDNIITLIQEVASQFQRSGADPQNIQKTTHDMREAEKLRNEMMNDARTLLQSKELYERALFFSPLLHFFAFLLTPHYFHYDDRDVEESSTFTVKGIEATCRP
jgi:hypothetical protein